MINFLREKLDRYGKDPQFYFKKEEKIKTNIGLFLSLLYFIIYIAYLGYKLYKMIKKVDVEFTDSNINPENPDSIHLTNENFYLGFAIEDPETYDTILDESIYYPKAYFKQAVREGKEWIWNIKELELEPCKIEKFGSIYKDIFKKKLLGLHYYFKEMNETLTGHFSYDNYSMFYISLFPCRNTTENNNKCKPLEDIDKYLKGTFVTMQFQDILLTPNDYNNPIKGRDQDLYTTFGKRLFKEFHIYFKIVNIETDLDFIGIDEIKNVRENKYIKYDSFNQMTKLLDKDVYETGESFCDITLKLSDLVFYQKRKYTKLLNILGDVGGLMEIINDFFEFISSFIVDIIYEISLVNKLFKLGLIKEEKNNINRIYTCGVKKKILLSKGPTIEETKTISPHIKKPKPKINFIENGGLSSKNGVASKENNNEINIYEVVNNAINNYNDNIREEKLIIPNKFCLYFCFLCHSYRKEGKKLKIHMDKIKEKLDIISIYKRLYQKKEKDNSTEINYTQTSS